MNLLLESTSHFKGDHFKNGVTVVLTIKGFEWNETFATEKKPGRWDILFEECRTKLPLTKTVGECWIPEFGTADDHELIGKRVELFGVEQMNFGKIATVIRVRKPIE